MNATLLERNVRLPEAFPQTSLEFDVEDLGASVVLVQVRGAATGEQADDLNEQLRSFLIQGLPFVILDLTGLSFVSPSALQTLAEFSRDFGRRGGEVWLVGLQAAVWLALHRAQLGRLFTIRVSRTEALGA
jgi:anti-anti-sigma factor